MEYSSRSDSGMIWEPNKIATKPLRLRHKVYLTSAEIVRGYLGTPRLGLALELNRKFVWPKGLHAQANIYCRSHGTSHDYHGSLKSQ